MRTKIGLGVLLLGAMMGESECLIIPALVIAIGTALIIAGKLRGEQDDDL